MMKECLKAMSALQRFKKLLIAAMCLCASLASVQVSAMPIFVGSFNVFDGPSWQTSPVPLSARQVAAMLYGGTYSDYAISVVNSSDWQSITHTAWVDGWGDLDHLQNPVNEDFFSAATSGLYDDFPAYSAWVCDHADCTADGFLANEGWSGFNYTNYVWRTTPVLAVPEPSTLALLIAALLVFTRLSRRTQR